MTSLKKKTVSGLKWSAIERIATQGIQLVVMLILGRMLGPEAFGLIGMLVIFIAIAQIFVDSGFGNALIRKQDRDEKDFSTVFYCNIAVSITCYLLIYFGAPYVSDFYNEPELTSLLRILGINIIINAISLVQRTKLTIDMDFKKLTKSSLISVFISTLVAFSFAFCGFGVWALIAQRLSSVFSNAILIQILVPWRPKERFSKSSFDELFGFSSKLLLTSLIDTIYKNIYQIIIGKLFSSAQVGFFTQAKTLSNTPAMTITSIIQRVTYPMLSQMQNDTEKLDAAYLLTLRLSAAVIFPLMIGLALISEPLINVVLGQEWSESVPLMIILCIGYMLYPIHAINLNLLQVKGRSDLLLKIEIVKKIIITLILIITIRYGVKAICIGMLAQSYISLLINTYYTGKLSSLSLFKQVRSLAPIWLVCIAIGGFNYFLSLTLSNDVYKILVMLTSSLVLYILYIRICQKDLYENLLNSIVK
ncbi:lipopolysaccharide biosynthesis protein [Aliivibrio fischeri]|uniref:lipopolysaccharide biosynthesis protein n=1 Tax=Aliivibrio fischeri TaxID=668 RepID=UPI0007C52104|nr:lipopolysaccharide biosynthesis protein [Aliivibrio fischeri]